MVVVVVVARFPVDPATNVAAAVVLLSCYVAAGCGCCRWAAATSPSQRGGERAPSWYGQLRHNWSFVIEKDC